jgi:hypothetical protein
VIAPAIALSLAIAIACGLAGCGGCDDGPPAGGDAGPADAGAGEGDAAAPQCDAGDAAFVRSAILAVLGRRPRSSDEVALYVDLMAGLRGLDTSDTAAAAAATAARTAVVRALSGQPDYVERWSDLLMDALRVPRIEQQSMVDCYGRSLRPGADPALAAALRDAPASGTAPGTSAPPDGGPFTLLDLARSSLRLDDLTPLYRAHLFALVSRPIRAANVPPIDAELARRDDFGAVFDAAYLNRDLACLGCHSSESSVTDSPDPLLDRHWPLPGLFEQALYGASTGIDPDRAHAVFRVSGFFADPFDGLPGERPWGWDPACGAFHREPAAADPAHVDGRFGRLTGQWLTVYRLEESLGRGLERLRGAGLALGSGGAIADPDDAFAYLVAASVVEQVWREVVGTPLTIANHFPRNQAAGDTLRSLTDRFVARGYSLVDLLAAILTGPYANLLAPEVGCGAAPYAMPAIFDPWSKGEVDPARRGNGAGDAVQPLSARTLARSAYAALGWPEPRTRSFPEQPAELAPCSQLDGCDAMLATCTQTGVCCVAHDWLCVDPLGEREPTPAEELDFQRTTGGFLKNAERGFRGLDFQARLAWEERFGACVAPTDEPDYVAALAARAVAAGASVGDAVTTLKDRLIGAPLRGADERDAVEALLGLSLATPAADAADLDAALRRLCGVLLASPQFLLGGLADADNPAAGAAPLTPDDARYRTLCDDLATDPPSGTRILCSDQSLQVVRERSGPTE